MKIFWNLSENKPGNLFHYKLVVLKKLIAFVVALGYGGKKQVCHHHIETEAQAAAPPLQCSLE